MQAVICLKGAKYERLVRNDNTVYQGQAMINMILLQGAVFSKLAVNNGTIHVPVENIKMITKMNGYNKGGLKGK